MTEEHSNAWAAAAIRRVGADGPQVAPTPLRRLPLAAIRDIQVYLKDESAHPTGSMKYRLVRAMFCEAIASGAIKADTPVIAATSGPVAIAGAHFASLLSLDFTAVVPARTPPEVLARISGEGGRWQIAEQPPAAAQEEARALAEQFGGHFLDHFTDAERAMAVCGEPTVADEIFVQLSREQHPIPQWIVTGAGTGATSAAVGRHLRRHGHPTRLAVVDPENSAYFPAWVSGCGDYTTGMPSRIPGIGRPRTEPGFLPTVIDLMIPVPDAASIAALRWLRTAAGIEAGPATGTNFWGTCHLVARMREAGVRGSIVTLIGDTAGPYLNTHLNPSWVHARGLDPAPYEADIERFVHTGEWPAGARPV
ncbi:PLP-dependent cysteine synthase family protein [Streptomyces sp. NPDC050422]|uniref:PLP-dependent cysteine synthase family protein n=1 Tax=Streptomyces sp. NPDC050422 TaxID=3365614 RepID=UPI0037ABCB41